MAFFKIMSGTHSRGVHQADSAETAIAAQPEWLAPMTAELVTECALCAANGERGVEPVTTDLPVVGNGDGDADRSGMPEALCAGCARAVRSFEIAGARHDHYYDTAGMPAGEHAARLRKGEI